MQLKNISAGTLGFIIITLAILALVFFPLVAIWAINNLFTANIAYTFINWLSVVLLGVFFRGTVSANK